MMDWQEWEETRTVKAIWLWPLPEKNIEFFFRWLDDFHWHNWHWN